MTQYPADSELLHSLAETGNISQITQLINEAKSGLVSAETSSQLKAVETRFSTLNTFMAAREELIQLDSKRPEYIQVTPRANLIPVSVKVTDAAKEYEALILKYLSGLQERIGRIYPNEPNAALDFKHIALALQNRNRQQHTLDYLTATDGVTSEWIRDRAHRSGVVVTEAIWEIALTGRDTAVLAATPGASERTIQSYLDGWRGVADNGFQTSTTEFDTAINWLIDSPKAT